MPCTPKVSLIGRLIRFPGSMKFQNEEGKKSSPSERTSGGIDVCNPGSVVYVYLGRHGWRNHRHGEAPERLLLRAPDLIRANGGIPGERSRTVSEGACEGGVTCCAVSYSRDKFGREHELTRVARDEVHARQERAIVCKAKAPVSQLTPFLRRIDEVLTLSELYGSKTETIPRSVRES